MRPALVLCLLLTMMTPTTIARNTDNANAPAVVPASTPIPSPPAWLSDIDSLYDAGLRAAGLDDRMFSAEHWWSVATPLLERKRGFRVEEIGRSVEGRPLRHVRWGTGKTSVLLWSQMHGDESTASMALADLFRFLGEHPDDPRVQALRANTTLHFFPFCTPCTLHRECACTCKQTGEPCIFHGFCSCHIINFCDWVQQVIRNAKPFVLPPFGCKKDMQESDHISKIRLVITYK